MLPFVVLQLRSLVFFAKFIQQIVGGLEHDFFHILGIVIHWLIYFFWGVETTNQKMYWKTWRWSCLSVFQDVSHLNDNGICCKAESYSHSLAIIIWHPVVLWLGNWLCPISLKWLFGDLDTCWRWFGFPAGTQKGGSYEFMSADSISVSFILDRRNDHKIQENYWSLEIVILYIYIWIYIYIYIYISPSHYEHISCRFIEFKPSS